MLQTLIATVPQAVLGRLPIAKAMRSRFVVVWLGVFFASVEAACAQTPPQPTEPPAEPERIDLDRVDLGFADADSAQVEALAARLADMHFETREQAADELARLGPAAFRTLARVYRESGNYEVRLRIEEIVRDRFLWHTLLKHKGFLGIRFNGGGVWLRDSRVSEEVFAIPVESVEPGFPADKAGLLAGDLIITLDGHHLDDLPDNQVFPDVISAKGAGAQLALTILRGAQKVELEVTLQARPVELYDQPGELKDELNAKLQAFSEWWAKHFAVPEHSKMRTTSSVVIEMPE